MPRRRLKPDRRSARSKNARQVSRWQPPTVGTQNPRAGFRSSYGGASVRHRLEGFLASRHVANLITEREDRLIVLLQGGEELDALISEHLTGAETHLRDLDVRSRCVRARSTRSAMRSSRSTACSTSQGLGGCCVSRISASLSGSSWIRPRIGWSRKWASFYRRSRATRCCTKRWSSTSTWAELQRPFTCTPTRFATGWAVSRSCSDARYTSCRPSPACTSRRRSTGCRADPRADRRARATG
jgi:hypothetical protein